ncbi:hypothetical protein [Actinopolymorpha pittospori]
MAAIRREPDGAERRFHCFVRLEDLDFDPSEPGAVRQRSLDIGGFYQRHPQLTDASDSAAHPNVLSAQAAATELVTLLVDRPSLVGATPSFDAESFLHLLDMTGLLPPAKVETPWAGRLVCVWGLVAGRFGINPATLDRDQVHKHLGIDPSEYAGHTALDDTRWVKDVYDAVVTA